MNLFQALIVMTLCGLSVGYFSLTNLNEFLSVDSITLFIAVIFLSSIIAIVGWASAVSNALFSWIFFHLFMVSLLAIELVVSHFATELSAFLISASHVWEKSDDGERSELQIDLGCCGLANVTDRPAGNCPPGIETGCLQKLEDLLANLKNVASVAMFFCFVFGLFIDFAGCAICFHPETLTLADHEREQVDLMTSEVDLDAFSNSVL
jgi:hypothetical protein